MRASHSLPASPLWPGLACCPLIITCTDTYRKNDVLSIQESIVNHVEYTLARTRHQFDDFECYQAAAFSLRDRLIEMWNDTQTYYKCVGGLARLIAC